ncbi:hypothetical protein NDU88_005817 [Pleurodeles waltl]|uniref:Uncharacterized protein n=1 Tax=Pleurodeles waltl TaxID=8319 RepID=A0AAV7RQB7_PLEWA|nr:hypothetical protein NDU88_005817 [Pleurodeles waltl]
MRRITRGVAFIKLWDDMLELFWPREGEAGGQLILLPGHCVPKEWSIATTALGDLLCGHKRTDASQGNTMEQYTTPVAPLRRPAGLEVSGDAAGAPLSAGEPSQTELLVAIQGSRVALEGKIETVAVEVNLLTADLRKVADKVKVAEGSICGDPV